MSNEKHFNSLIDPEKKERKHFWSTVRLSIGVVLVVIGLSILL